jgi:hypothetical protein
MLCGDFQDGFFAKDQTVNNMVLADQETLSGIPNPAK